MPNVFVEPEPKGSEEGTAITHYVLELIAASASIRTNTKRNASRLKPRRNSATSRLSRVCAKPTREILITGEQPSERASPRGVGPDKGQANEARPRILRTDRNRGFLVADDYCRCMHCVRFAEANCEAGQR